ncbi:UdgX family uracil-DNA binding protein [Luteimonas kalidii]|uniref:Type-4 uracil-DNA glycosylase n=1 Tax=Luteimonas kalidii TaxID=3042025 RepID=A0ABT6JRT9_9GAMM|nr:UdgX family uracil-DNA binding protein [Luteimonas kalidii]MDH5833312.1 UdgX family uracil-DNA binding protein [Luteimonas kalidii]
MAAWRDVARAALRAQVPPDALDWLEGDAPAPLLAAPDIEGATPRDDAPRAPKSLLELAPALLCHREPQRLGLLYRLLWRATHGEPALLSNPADADVRRAQAWVQAVRRDAHKMKAFVRFRAVPGDDNAFIAWFEPEHRIVDRVAPFFARRFAGMRWAILTPYRSAHWDGEALAFGDGGMRADAPADDAREELWRTYYAHIFNPARLNPRMMRQEMPVKYWKHLPEAQLLPGLVREAGVRVREMAERAPQPPRRTIRSRPGAGVAMRGQFHGPEGSDGTPGIGHGDGAARATPATGPASGQLATDATSLDALRELARDCRACPLWAPATQTVFGEGPATARVVLVGEQPGDTEDLTGRPFTGPAGQLLDRALGELGIDRTQLYLTNAVKHFRFERRGKRRLHRNPEAGHVQACRPWLARELALLQPEVVVSLGATAALALMGRGFRLMDERGRWHTLSGGTRLLATVHPAWILRQRDDAARDAAYAGFVADLAQLAARGNPRRTSPPPS